MTMTATIAQTHLDAWLAADLAVSTGKTYSIAGRSLTRANVTEIREQIAYWHGVVRSLTAEANGATSPAVRIAKWS